VRHGDDLLADLVGEGYRDGRKDGEGEGSGGFLNEWNEYDLAEVGKSETYPE
jgi:hypothetical protein